MPILEAPLDTLPPLPAPAPETVTEDNVFTDLSRIQEIESVIDAMTATWRPTGMSLRERRWHRVVYERPIVVQPLVPAGDGEYQYDGPSLLVAGRDLSLGGLSFEHETSLPHRFVAVSFPLESMHGASIITQLTWCRFTRDGAYLGGGRFLRKVVTSDLVPAP